jgi:hypothetical protein
LNQNRNILHQTSGSRIHFSGEENVVFSTAVYRQIHHPPASPICLYPLFQSGGYTAERHVHQEKDHKCGQNCGLEARNRLKDPDNSDSRKTPAGFLPVAEAGEEAGGMSPRKENSE